MSGDQENVPLPDMQRRILLVLDEDIILLRRKLDELLTLRAAMLSGLMSGGYKMADEIIGQGTLDETADSKSK